MMRTAEIQMKLQLRCHIFISFLQDTVPWRAREFQLMGAKRFELLWAEYSVSILLLFGPYEN